MVVKDGYLMDETVPRWYNVQGPDGKFVYAVNTNLGLKASDPEADILLIGDDVRLKHLGTVEQLVKVANSDDNIGLLSPKILGGADNLLQTNPPADKVISYSERYLALVCTYIKRKVINKIGYLDETFNQGWGWDDVDYSRRARLAGFTLAVTPTVEVIHGVRRKGSESLIRNEKGDDKAMQAQDDLNAKVYFQKWGDNTK